jgi:hypothetical protein
MIAMATPRIGLGRQAWNFGRHYLEMCVAMCAAGVPLTLVVLAAISSLMNLGLREQYPALYLVLIAFSLTLPMSGWMWFRGMPWRPILEMAAAAFAVAVMLIAAVAVGFAGRGMLQVTVGEFCGLSCLAMFVVMLFRLDLYTGRTGHHMAHAAHGA